MNYLINIYLAPFIGNKERIIGNVIAEFIKYTKRSKYSAEVEEGIQIHNSICEFMKQNAAFNKSKNRVNPKFTRYANDIVKLYYSHFLAANWESYTDNTLESSVKNTYLILLENFDIVPSKLKKMVPALISQPGLGSLSTVGGVHNFIGELSRKGFCVAYLQNTLQDLLVDYSSFKSDFDEFLLDLNKVAAEYKSKESEKTLVLANAS